MRKTEGQSWERPQSVPDWRDFVELLFPPISGATFYPGQLDPLRGICSSVRTEYIEVHVVHVQSMHLQISTSTIKVVIKFDQFQGLNRCCRVAAWKRPPPWCDYYTTAGEGSRRIRAVYSIIKVLTKFKTLWGGYLLAYMYSFIIIYLFFGWHYRSQEPLHTPGWPHRSHPVPPTICFRSLLILNPRHHVIQLLKFHLKK